MRRWVTGIAAAAVLLAACAAEDPVEASGCADGVPSDTHELLVEEATDCANGRLVVFDHTASRDAYRVAAELRGVEVLKSGDAWLLLEKE